VAARSTKIKIASKRDRVATGLGDEPLVYDNNSFNWYNGFYKYDDAKKFAILYLTENESLPDDELKIVASISKYSFIPMGWVFRMLSIGVDVPQEVIDRNLDKLQTLISVELDKQQTSQSPEQSFADEATELENIRQNMSKAELQAISKRKIAASLDRIIGELPVKWSCAKWFHNVTLHGEPHGTDHLYSFVGNTAIDWYQATKGWMQKEKDPKQRSNMLKRLVLLGDVIKTSYILMGADVPNLNNLEAVKPVDEPVVKVRKRRAKKIKSPEQLTSKIKYMISDDKYNVTSIKPTQIIGALQLFTFNTKTRFLSFYDTAEGQTLTVKGTTVIGFDEKKSFQKKVRKPEVTLKELMTAAKPASRKLVTTIPAVAKPLNGRISDDVLLMKVYK
jgi:hypothetical protein